MRPAPPPSTHPSASQRRALAAAPLGSTHRRRTRLPVSVCTVGHPCLPFVCSSCALHAPSAPTQHAPVCKPATCARRRPSGKYSQATHTAASERVHSGTPLPPIRVLFLCTACAQRPHPARTRLQASDVRSPPPLWEVLTGDAHGCQ